MYKMIGNDLAVSGAWPSLTQWEAYENMSPDEVQEVLNVRPFVPVRVYLSNGRTHDILDPNTAHVGQEAVLVGVYGAGTRFPRWRLLSLININEIEPLTPAQL